jgi:hypothetical protein
MKVKDILQKKKKESALVLSKKILVLREILITIERLPEDDRARFCDIIGGLVVFLENELDPELH